MQKNTLCVHSGTYRDESTRGLNSPIFTSSSFEYRHVQDCLYPRHFNTPNQQAVERPNYRSLGVKDAKVRYHHQQFSLMEYTCRT